jgi:hypothetical protein
MERFGLFYQPECKKYLFLVDTNKHNLAHRKNLIPCRTVQKYSVVYSV